MSDSITRGKDLQGDEIKTFNIDGSHAQAVVQIDESGNSINPLETLLGQILQQLKIINIHLGYITDTQLTENDVEG